MLQNLVTIGSMEGRSPTGYHVPTFFSRILHVLPQCIPAFSTPAFYTYSVPHSRILFNTRHSRCSFIESCDVIRAAYVVAPRNRVLVISELRTANWRTGKTRTFRELGRWLAVTSVITWHMVRKIPMTIAPPRLSK